MKSECCRCQCEIKMRPNAKYCDTCKEEVRKVVVAGINERKKERQRSARLAIVEWERTKYKSSISDEEQKQLNLQVDMSHRFFLDFKQYKQGTPEFEQVSRQCKQIERICP